MNFDKITEKLDEWYENSEFIKNRAKKIAEYVNVNGIKSKKIYSLKDDKPNKIYPTNFIRYPKIIFKAIRRNSREFTKNELVVLDHILAQAFNYNRNICYVKWSEMEIETDISTRNIKRAVKTLAEKDIIKKIEITERETKRKLALKYQIYTKYAFLVNIHPETWNMKLKNVEDLMSYNEEMIESEIKSIK